METMEMGRVADGDAGEDVRVLRRLEVREGLTGEGVDEGAFTCAVVDVETTGLDIGSDAMIQFGMRRFRFDADGVITRIGACHSFLEARFLAGETGARRRDDAYVYDQIVNLAAQLRAVADGAPKPARVGVTPPPIGLDPWRAG